MPPTLGPFSLERIEAAVEKVHQRLLRATAALEAAGLTYAVAGGHAVALHVSRVDDAAVRNTRDVDILIRREDFPAVRAALEAVGFVFRHVKSIDAFLDGPDAKFRDAVHLLYFNERVHPDAAHPNPAPTDAEPAERFRVLTLDALIRNKLTAYRRKDQVHLLDFIDLGLITNSTPATLPPPLDQRLQTLLDDPEG